MEPFTVFFQLFLSSSSPRSAPESGERMEKPNYRPPYTAEDFNRALEILRSGQIPDGMSDLTAYINHTSKELVEYAVAVTECVVLQNVEIQKRDTKIGALEAALEKATGLKREGRNGREI